ncbi:hypothetical protein Rs2_35632 [Raphanus sativus]|nr:hypothetical protein Rs2_35632 [Raphanus sativus]
MNDKGSLYLSSSTRTQPTRPISPTPISQTREEVTELRGMIRTLADKAREQKLAHRNIGNQLEQNDRELAEHWASVRGSNPPSRNTGTFGTSYFLSTRFGRYVGENTQQNPQPNSAYRNLNYGGSGEDPTGVRGSPSTPLCAQNGTAGRTEDLETRPHLPTSEVYRIDFHHREELRNQLQALVRPDKTKGSSSWGSPKKSHKEKIGGPMEKT